ncbi:MAG: hypothetical protein AAF650_06855 [Pseudomonadota bacterium]
MIRTALLSASILGLVSLPSEGRAQVDPHLASLSRPKVMADCKVVTKELEVGSVNLVVEGGRAFKLEVDDENVPSLPRLTKRELSVVKDDLDLFASSVPNRVQFNSRAGSAQFLFESGGSARLTIRQVPPYTDGPDDQLFEINVRGQAPEGTYLGPLEAVGFCMASETEQKPLSDAEMEEWLAKARMSPDELLRQSDTAIPPPAPAAVSAPRRSRTRRSQPEQTPTNVTSPRYEVRCQLLSESFGSGRLEFSMIGGRGYYQPSSRPQRNRRATTTSRRMRVGVDELSLFDDKFPVEKARRNSAGPPEAFQSFDEINWNLSFAPLSGAAGRTGDEDKTEGFRIQLAPGNPRSRRGDQAQELPKQNYLGVCIRESSPQEPLSQKEIQEEMWR